MRKYERIQKKTKKDEKNYEYIDGQEIETNATDFEFIDYKKSVKKLYLNVTYLY